MADWIEFLQTMQLVGLVVFLAFLGGTWLDRPDPDVKSIDDHTAWAGELGRACRRGRDL